MDKSSIDKNAGRTSEGSIGCVIVNYNTPKIISRAVNSIKDLVDEVMIVDGSDMRNPAYLECDELELFNGNINVQHVGYNIGHGNGLHLGIDLLKTEYIICMDSDAAIVDESVIDEMKAKLTDNIYGCGMVVNVDENGKNKADGFDYLHPYFCMFKKSTYKANEPFINHGAPFIRAMKSINEVIEVVNIDNIQEKVFHEHRRTRLVSNDWLKNWDKP